MTVPQMMVTGTRLAYVVVPIKEKVKRNIIEWTRGKGLSAKSVEQPGGFLVFFPRGHVLRLTAKQLRRYTHDGKPLKEEARLINLQGLNDPNSPIGKLLMAQEADQRVKGFKELEKLGVKLATARTGPITVTMVEPPPEFTDESEE